MSAIYRLCDYSMRCESEGCAAAMRIGMTPRPMMSRRMTLCFMTSNSRTPCRMTLRSTLQESSARDTRSCGQADSRADQPPHYALVITCLLTIATPYRWQVLAGTCLQTRCYYAFTATFTIASVHCSQAVAPALLV